MVSRNENQPLTHPLKYGERCQLQIKFPSNLHIQAENPMQQVISVSWKFDYGEVFLFFFFDWLALLLFIRFL